MPIVRQIAVLALLLLAAQPATAATLWQNVAAGMTWHQLKAARPATLPIPPELRSHYLTECTHMDGTAKAFGASFEVCYDLRGGTVNAVILRSGESLTVQLSGIRAELIRTYGKPELDECEPIEIGNYCSIMFRKPDVSIEVGDIFFEQERTHSLTIRYE